MMDTALQEHLASGLTTLSRCWSITRRDGVVHGFTDHDVDLEFDGQLFKADTGMTALALEQSTGLSVDNTEAMGALSDAAIREEDIEAGRYDGAEVLCWLVNWADVAQRSVQFRGSIGELRRSGGAFHAELRGLTELLNRPLGRVYQKPCTAVLGDGGCGFDLDTPGFAAELAVETVDSAQVFTFALSNGAILDGFAGGWFKRGRLVVQSGVAAQLSGLIKKDITSAGKRVIELWQPLRADVVAGDMVRLVAGCDKRFSTCRAKFGNHLNFQGFPDLPGDDWSLALPSASIDNGGGSRR